jgi:hypothetical protein
MEWKQTIKAEKTFMGLSTAGNRNNHLDLLCPRIALCSVSVNSQEFRASTCMA